MAITTLLGAGLLLLFSRRHYAPEAGTARPALVPVEFGDLPGWRTTDARPALQAFARSCSTFGRRPATAQFGPSGYAGAVKDWRSVCEHLPASGSAPAGIRGFFEARFQPMEVVGESTPALFTGYYEPELAASRTRHGRYHIPIYGPPDNLISVDLGDFRPEWVGQHLYGCLAQRRLRRCPSRAQIHKDGLSNAPVLFYADDPEAVFFLQIQGSGRIHLENGSMVRATYAGQNGWPYKPIGRTLIDRGWLDRTHMSMQSIRDWLKRHPVEAQGVMETDPSYVFFREDPLDRPEEGAVGSEGVPLTPEASLAVDPRVHPLGIPVYVAAFRPDPEPSQPYRRFEQLVVAQDTGGAIRGAARGDVYWGWGARAEAIAGRMKAAGRFFVLLPKGVATRLGKRHPLSGS